MTLLNVVGSLMLIAGCGADTSEEGDQSKASSPDEVASIEARLQALGFDTSELKVEGESVSIGDVAFERSKLLAGEYDWASESSRKGEKAHYVGGTPLYWTKSANIKIVWSTAAADAPSTAVKNAIINAAGDFNSTCNGTPSCAISFSQTNTGPTMMVHLTPADNWPPTPCKGQANIIGCATYPSSGSPGGHVYFKASKLSPNCNAWTTQALAHVARHEMMHTLGFLHKGEGPYVVRNTMANPASTIMSASSNFVIPGCTLSPTVLQTDDKAGLRNLPIGNPPPG